MTLPLLILRPQPGAEETASRAQTMGLDVIVAPLFEIAARAWTPPNPADFDALLFTSATGVRMAGDGLARFAHLPVIAVGEATASAARAAGLSVAEVGSGDGASVVAQSRFHQMLHLAGQQHVALDSPRVNSVLVYAAEEAPLPTLPPEAIVLLHSGRAARRFRAIAADRRGYALVAISPAVAAEAGEGWRSVTAAERPSDAAMLAMAAPLCEDPDHGV